MTNTADRHFSLTESFGIEGWGGVEKLGRTARHKPIILLNNMTDDIRQKYYELPLNLKMKSDTLEGLFETHPEVQETFLPFRQLSKIDMEKSEILKSHALRVMGTVDKCMARVEKPDKFQDLMEDLGGRHRNYNAKYEYIEMVGPQFVHAIKPHLNDTWSDEMEDAWMKLFKLMSYYMKNGLTENGVSSSTHRTEKNT